MEDALNNILRQDSTIRKLVVVLKVAECPGCTETRDNFDHSLLNCEGQNKEINASTISI